jgi:hypothetical protein
MIQLIVEIEPEEDDFQRVQSLRSALQEGIGSLVTEFYGTGSRELHGFEETATTVKSITIDGRLFNPSEQVLEAEDPIVPEILGTLEDLGKRVRGQVTITPKREGEMLIDWGGGVTYLLGDANPAYALISRGLALAADEDAVSETEEGGIK